MNLLSLLSFRGLNRLIGVVASMACALFQVRAADISVDFSRVLGPVKPLHGGNNGPLGYGEIVDLTTDFRAMGIPIIRLHDSAWPYPDIVDVHAIFPDFKADPSLPASYRFGPTDDYLRAITNAGAGIVYRLGESIEHARRKRYVHPPTDPEKWAAICEGIIRHYNEGWADGHHLGIVYWEIWNEPENRPAMWSGTPAGYYRLYSVTARRLKARWPHLKIGGPSLGHQGDFKPAGFVPSVFLKDFMEHVAREKAPLDFFSWHIYTNDPLEPGRRARAIRAFLDQRGYSNTESHLNEWNYLPDNDWGPMTSGGGAAREAWYARQGGIEGAVFAASVLMDLQDAPIDVANFYSTDNQPFGLFTLHGAAKRSATAFRFFQSAVSLGRRVQAGCESRGSSVLASINTTSTRATILVSCGNANERLRSVRISGLPWGGSTRMEIHEANRHQETFRTASVIREGSELEIQIAVEPPCLLKFDLEPK